MLLLAGALLLAAEQGDHVAAHHARELADDGKAQAGSPKFCAVEASAWVNSSNSFACCSAVSWDMGR